MCGIVGFTGNHQAAPILLYGLSRLEYRGYDSAGLAVRDGEGDTEVIKAKGRLKVLADKTNNGESVPGTCGIGHTRWATHGEPSETNAHPHMSDDGNVVAVHNGIIENYQELKDKLIRNGYEFYSSTDTEVAVKLVDYYYKKYLGTPVDAINHAMVRIRGSYALAIMFKDYPGEIYVARKDSPMILGVENGESYIASDVPAILKYTRNVYYIGNMEIGRLAEGKATFYNLDGDEIQKELVEIKWDAKAAEKGGFEHFMMKEIHEQPKAILDTMNSKIKEGKIDLSDVGLSEEDMKEIAHLCEKVARKYYEIPKDQRNGKCQITASSSFFVPKPFTPFQWAPMCTAEEYTRRAHLVNDEFKAQLNRKSLKYNWHDANVTVLEGIMARGDRRIGKVIEEAYRLGCLFDSWTESFRDDLWEKAFLNTGIEKEFYTLRTRDKNELFPWDFIDTGVSRKFLRKEWERAMNAEVTPNCREHCSGCGASKFGGGVCYEGKN